MNHTSNLRNSLFFVPAQECRVLHEFFFVVPFLLERKLRHFLIGSNNGSSLAVKLDPSKYQSRKWQRGRYPTWFPEALLIPFESRVVSMQLLGQSLKYSTKISGDSDTPEDFRSTNKLEGSGISVQDVVQQDVKINPVMIYMKGVPDAPRCGFSALAIKVLQQYKVPISSRDILEDPVLKECNGQLKELLSDINGDNSKPSSE
ncbi:hypothetical protein M5K25_008406 [Dendrobium thyrsiflorum]|uniref:Glutaredoxin domain-containing protein n=1 Tax=Dendrobium thyrsiflorum TaxID=117978 RepID=A0ABD0VFS5_DENTH